MRYDISEGANYEKRVTALRGGIFAMDVLNVSQFWGIGMYFLGSYVLGVCSKWEQKEDAFLRDPRNRMGKRPGDVVRPKTFRGTVMTVAGCMLSVGGAVMFFMNIDMG